MRLLHVVPSYLPATRYGGPIYSVHGLCKALAALGHDVHVLTTSVDGAADSPVPLDRSVDLDGVNVRYYPSRVLRRLYYAPAMQRALTAEIARFDLVHLHSVFLWPTAMAARLAARAGVPYVLSPRGMLVGELIARKSRWLKAAWLTVIESETMARAAAIHLTSERELADVRALALPLPAPFVLPNGVDAPAFGNARGAGAPAAAVVARGPYALYLGRIHWKKGLATALQALRGSDIRLVLAGPDEDGHAEQLAQLARELGVAGQVERIGEVTGDDKWALLRAAQFVILPSINENFGNSVLEAMAVGRPVIVSEAVGVSALVREAGAGIVCAASAEGLGAAMRALWSDRARADALGRAAAQAAQALGWSQIAERMSARYRALVSGPAALAGAAAGVQARS